MPNVLAYVLPSISVVRVNEASLKQAKAELLAQLHVFNQVLLEKTYLVGERFTIADVSVALDLLPAYQNVLDEAARDSLGNVNRWFKTVVNHPVVKEVVGSVDFIKQASTFDGIFYF